MSAPSCVGSLAASFTSSSVGGSPTRMFFTFATYAVGGSAWNGSPASAGVVSGCAVCDDGPHATSPASTEAPRGGRAEQSCGRGDLRAYECVGVQMGHHDQTACPARFAPWGVPTGRGRVHPATFGRR